LDVHDEKDSGGGGGSGGAGGIFSVGKSRAQIFDKDTNVKDNFMM
jgi:cell division protease FtsH